MTMSSEDRERTLATLMCPRGHAVGVSDGVRLWPFGSRIDRMVTLICDHPACDRYRRWHPAPPERTSRCRP